VPAADAATAATAAAAGGGDNAERDSYQKAFDLMKAGRYDEAIAAFRGFLARYPDGEYSANAQYWVGESNYVLRRFDEAAAEFGKVIDFFPDSGKAPDALLKLGFSQYELQQWDKAGQTLTRVVQQYPRSTARQLAEGRLQRMRMEGH
jgi:tol-pal system protein YbgF